MPKTKEELDQLKKDYQSLTERVRELSNEELENVMGGCSTYSSDNYGTLCIYPSFENGQNSFYHPLITTVGNSCRLVEDASTCLACKHRASGGFYKLVSYCKARSKEHDPGK